MPLSGKLILGFLQEDNPQKSFFRFKPLYIIEEKSHQAIDAGERYPDDGFLRIVPDKNEINHFKARMRQIGPLGALDLRRFPEESNKIRPNKNYQPDGPEKNAYIVYSDVICLPPRHLCAEIIDTDELPGDASATLNTRQPLTPLIALRSGGRIGGLWHWSEAEEKPGCVTVAACGGTCTPDAEALEDRLLTIAVNEELREVLLELNDFGIDPEPQRSQAKEKPAPVPERPVPPAMAPSTDDTYSSTTTAPEQTAAPIPEAEKKPWIHHDASIAPRAVSARLSPREQNLRAQTGINPRRNRSLSEVIDDQWRRSRIDQLGHPVPGAAMGMPLLNPAEQAVEAIKAAFRSGEAKPRLIDALLKDPILSETLCEALGAAKRATDVKSEEALNEFEAARLKIVAEIDELKARRNGVKEKVVEEVKADYRAEFAELEARGAALRAAAEGAEAEAETARQAAQTAERSIDELFGDRFDAKLAESVAQSRAKKLIRCWNKPEEPRFGGIPKIYDPSPEDLIGTVYAGLIGAGFALSRFDVINLLASLTVGRLIVLSGEPGCGKTALATALAAALGLCAPDATRFARCTSLPDKRIAQLAESADQLTMSLAFADDLNAMGDDAAVESLIAVLERKDGTALRAIAAAQDAPAGRSLSHRLLDRAFFLRLSPPPMNWAGEALVLPAPGRAVSLGALKRAFNFDAELPEAVEEKLRALRMELDTIGWRMSYRVTGELRRYCAAVIPYREENPLEVLDRAIAQRALPSMLAAMEWGALSALPKILKGMKWCEALMAEPLPVPPIG